VRRGLRQGEEEGIIAIAHLYRAKTQVGTNVLHLYWVVSWPGINLKTPHLYKFST
jgi:hypothetical protein